MSRGGMALAWGIGVIIVSLCGGAVLQQAAISAMKSSSGFDDAASSLQSLSFFSAILNLAFLGGIVAGIVGIVLLIVDSGRADQPPPPYNPPQPPQPQRPPPSATEEENRRLREEVERLRSERERGSSGPPPSAGSGAEPPPAPDPARI